MVISRVSRRVPSRTASRELRTSSSEIALSRLLGPTRGKLRHWIARLLPRARVILLASNGLSGKEIALKMGTRQARVSKWLRRCGLERMAGLNASARSAGERRKNTSVTEKRNLKALDEPAPAGYSRLNGRLLAEHLGNVSKDQIWRVMVGPRRVWYRGLSRREYTLLPSLFRRGLAG